MVAKFLNDNKLKTSLEKWICTVSNFIDLIQFHLICQMLAKFSGDEYKRTVSRLRKRKTNICVVFTNSISGHVKLGSFMAHSRTVMTKKCTKKRDAMQSCYFVYIHTVNLLLVCRSCCCHRLLSSLFVWFRNFPTLVTWHHTSPSL